MRQVSKYSTGQHKKLSNVSSAMKDSALDEIVVLEVTPQTNVNKFKIGSNNTSFDETPTQEGKT